MVAPAGLFLKTAHVEGGRKEGDVLLEKEIEKVMFWFELKYPQHKLTAHSGYRGKSEEYHFELTVDGKKYGYSFELPPGMADQSRDFIEDVREKFVQKQMQELKKLAEKIPELVV